MKKTLLISLVLSVMLTSCATVFSGSKARVTVNTNAGEPVSIKVDGVSQEYGVQGPTEVSVPRGFSPTKIEAESETKYGCVELKKSFNATSIINIIWPIGFAIDAGTGAMMKPQSKNVFIQMKNKDNHSQKEPDPKPQKQVQSAGYTDLDNTIVRWDVQSRPQGADLFWRVTSRTPEVKSTNNKYLQTTPYEATKALDIKGLTAETASNVSIILRCEKEGYLPQEKEYNVRMVLDQEEISAFFRLVKEDE